MTREIFDRLMQKLLGDKEESVRLLAASAVQISNLCESLHEVAKLCLKITRLWLKGGIKFKEKLQKLVFPEGIVYDREIGAFRTPIINSVIAEIARLSGDLLLKTKGLNPFLLGQSLFAERAGFEPAIRLPVYKLSRLAHSTTLTPLLDDLVLF